MNALLATIRGERAHDELQAIIDALAMHQTNAGQITAKLAALQPIAANYPGGTPAQQAAWNHGTNKADVTTAIANLISLQTIANALAMHQTNAGQITAKLAALQPIAANYPGGTPAQQAAWNHGTNKADVTTAIANLISLQTIANALAMHQTNAGQITAKLAALQPIAANYPGGTPAQQAAWN